MMRLGDLIRELHRRSVWQVLAVYAVVGWILLLLAEMVEGLLGFPPWFGPASTVVVLLGFPVLLATTLIQGGFKKEDLFSSGFRDSASGGDDSLSSWRSLEREPFREALRSLFSWRNAVAGGIIMIVVLGIGAMISAYL